ncbi:type II CAAX endopeptidase family protein [Vagococcus lutrae]|uniref:Type II CAAX endopeptidase family protein n=1 Tax=Vagococcus lutrae TaxID=81947 RepID=A0AAE9XF13_9ENTE|nr:type II CAAX endopeptidase family protein [Vagococcus lutrae]MDT2801443.1 type II CAAX endopeptidase family protein [Vagococcus lutrae]WCG23109.1 type II CAAX endopeptidase family protein [Vagococcus lutrae]
MYSIKHISKGLLFAFLLFIVYSLPSMSLALGNLPFILVTLVVLLLLIYLAKKRGAFDHLSPFFSWYHMKWIIGGFFLTRIGAIVFTMLLSGESSQNDQAIQELATAISPTTLFLLICVLAPIGEEIIFRYFIMNSFIDVRQPASTLGKVLAITVSVTLFSLVHGPTSILFFLMYATIGLVMAFAYLYTGDLRVAMSIHFLNNFLPFLVMTFASHLLPAN